MEKPQNVKMEISIAGEKITLTVPPHLQRQVRQTEENVRKLYDTWRRDFPDKSTKELLAMMAYQYASYYDQLMQLQERARDAAERTAHRLDRLLED